VFEAFVRRFMPDRGVIASDVGRDAMTAIANDTLARWCVLEPPPSESVYAAEAAEIHSAARAFLQMERDALSRGDGVWTDIEVGFGGDGKATYRLGDGRSIRLRGRADRIDTMPDGTLRIVDYKTGSPNPYRPNPKNGAFNGGRLIQPAAYAEALGGVLQRPVSRFEYRFPTDKGGNAIVPFTTADLSDARAVVAGLVDHVASGRFLPTTDAHDCQYCDVAPICRVRVGEHSADSPRAAWAKLHAPDLPEYATMLARRGAAGGDDE
jgi:hypothetical protein